MFLMTSVDFLDFCTAPQFHSCTLHNVCLSLVYESKVLLLPILECSSCHVSVIYVLMEGVTSMQTEHVSQVNLSNRNP